MNNFIKDMIYYINGINIFRMFICFILGTLAALIIAVFIRMIYDAKEFTEKVVNMLLKDFKSNKNQISKN